MRKTTAVFPLLFVTLAAGLLPPTKASAQVGGRLRRAAENAVIGETARQIDRMLRNAMRCVFDDRACIDNARREGKEVVLTDDRGNVLMDEKGVPVTDPDDVEVKAVRPGEGAWANYDFVPGDSILFYEDFTTDNVGDFPRRLSFVRGNWDIVEWQGRRLLRNTGPRHSAVHIPLPRELPEQFTIEIEAYMPHTNQQMVLATDPPAAAGNVASLQGHYIQIGVGPGTGVTARSREAVRATNRTNELAEALLPIRIMVDGQYAKVYVNERRVANVPNAEFIRSDRLHLENTYMASEEHPMLIGTIRVAAGGLDLYDVLERDGRVATQGILFATGSARIRPESTPTLQEIGAMLRDHPDLRISIEGHTDAVGDDAANQALSEERASSVRTYLVENFGVDSSRLESAGFGETVPVASNDTPEGRQQNRRVELVRRQ
jgi:OmpA-OmpF porin, OOP family